MAARSLKVVPITAPVHSDVEIETATDGSQALAVGDESRDRGIPSKPGRQYPPPFHRARSIQGNAISTSRALPDPPHDITSREQDGQTACRKRDVWAKNGSPTISIMSNSKPTSSISRSARPIFIRYAARSNGLNVRPCCRPSYLIDLSTTPSGPCRA